MKVIVMNSRRSFRYFGVLVSLAVSAGGLMAGRPAVAQSTYYWDNNGSTAGFGAAGGTWANPTTGNSSQGWSTSSLGDVVPGDVTTSTSDALNFGTGAAGLTSGSLTVTGTVNAGSMTFGSASQAITFGTTSANSAINLAAASTITINNSAALMYLSPTGAGTSLMITGPGELQMYRSGSLSSGSVVTVGGGATLGLYTGFGGSLGSGVGVTLGDASGTSSARIFFNNSVNLSNGITVAAGSSGSKAITANNAVTLSGNITANDNVTITKGGISGSLLSMTGTANSIAAGKTVTFVGNETGGSATQLGFVAATVWSGSGAMAYQAPGSVAITFLCNGTNSYSGGTTIGDMSGNAASVLVVQSNTCFGTGPLTLANNGRMNVSTGTDFFLANTVAITGNFSFPTKATEKSLTFNGTVDLGDTTRTLTVGIGATVTSKGVILANAVSGSGGITQNGTGRLLLNASNTYTGDTLVSSGKIVVGNNEALKNSAFDTSSLNGGLVLTGFTTPTFGGLVGSASLSNTLMTGYSSVTALTLNPQAGITKTYSGSIANGSGAMTLTKTGAGTQVLTGSSSYTGVTAVNGGVLQLDGMLGNTALSVAAAGWLAGSGTAPGAVTVSGNLAPGTASSIGVLSLGSLTLSGTSTFGFGTGTVRGTDFDGVNVQTAGGLTYGGQLAMDFSGLLATGTYNLFSFTGSPSGAFSNVLSSGSYVGSWSDVGGGAWQLASAGQTLTFNQGTGDLIIVPEPTTVATGLAALGLAITMLRRRQQDS
jgi:fibronectin-binding autotransporter adhesin